MADQQPNNPAPEAEGPQKAPEAPPSLEKKEAGPVKVEDLRAANEETKKKAAESKASADRNLKKLEDITVE